MKISTRILVLSLLLNWPFLQAQRVEINEVFFSEFITFYVSSIDISTGSTDVPLFEYVLRSHSVGEIPAYPVWVQINFNIEINSIPLGLTYETPFVSVQTNIFKMENAVRIKNTDLNMDTDQLFYVDGGPVAIGIDDFSTITDDASFNSDALFSQIVTSGSLPDGTYKFVLDIRAYSRDEDGGFTELEGDAIERIIVSAHPFSLELISPGGRLEDTLNTAISTTYPTFQWQSDPCAVCSYSIRVAEYKAEEHSSMDEAIEGQTVLPMDQAQGFYPVENVTSFQYPFTGAIDLDLGKIYIWQVEKTIPTTEGDETILSFLNAFKILDPTAATPPGGDETVEEAVVSSPILQFMQNVMGKSDFASAFGADGELIGFSPNSTISLNGTAIDLTQLTDLNNKINQGELNVLSVEVE